jgi:hypothetical protein
MATYTNYGGYLISKGPIRLLELNFENNKDYCLQQLVNKTTEVVEHRLHHIGKRVGATLAGWRGEYKDPSFEDCLALVTEFSNNLEWGVSEGCDNFFIGFNSSFMDSDYTARQYALSAFLIAWRMVCPTVRLNVIAPSEAKEILEAIPSYLDYDHYCIHNSDSLQKLLGIISY